MVLHVIVAVWLCLEFMATRIAYCSYLGSHLPSHLKDTSHLGMAASSSSSNGSAPASEPDCIKGMKFKDLCFAALPYEQNNKYDLSLFFVILFET